MEWRRFRYSTRSRGGLSGMNMDEIKNKTSNQAGGGRKFGTELTRNILNNQNNQIERIQRHNNRKRTFAQLNAEHKEEENNNYFAKYPKYEQPAKRVRYNLRKRERRESTESLQKENNHQKIMDIDSDESCDEDIDLITYKKKKKEKKMAFPIRRSLRLKIKRMKKLEEENKKRKKEKEKQQQQQQKEKEPVYILEESHLECDLNKIDDDLYVIDYVSDIMEWYKECESSLFQKELIGNNYISGSFQNDLNETMRIILLNWLYNVHRRFTLSDRTLFLGIYILDGYLSLVPIRREQLQLIGCAAIWIASKYHEIYAPEANDFAYISDYSFNVDSLFQTEIQILCKLKFKFANIMTPLHFIERYLQIAIYPLYKKYKQRGTNKALKDGQTYIDLLKHLTFYFNELSLFDLYLVSTTKPSLIAAASLCFAILSISLYPKWPEFLMREIKYKYNDLQPVLKRLNQLTKISKTKLKSVRKKHPAILKWLDRLNINAVLNNGNK